MSSFYIPTATAPVSAAAFATLQKQVTSLQNANSAASNQINTNAVESFGSSLALGSTTPTINVGTGAGVQTVNIGTGPGQTTINLGAAGDTVAVAGTLAVIDTTNLTVTDKYITLNKGGLTSSAGTSGIEIEENGTITGYLRSSADRSMMELKAPGGSLIKLNQSLATTDPATFTGLTASTGDINITTNGKRYLQQGLPVLNGTSTTTQSTYTGLNAGLNATGNFNTGTGYLALQGLTTGVRNTANGCGAFTALTTGTNNTGVGVNCGGSLATGSDNVIIGYNANCGAAVSNSIAIGSGATAAASNLIQIGTGSHTAVTLGNGTTTTLACGAITAPSLTGNLIGNASTVTTNANLTGEVTSVGNATTLSNAAVIAKVLTGYTANAGTISATDSLLAALGKVGGTLANATSAATAGTLMLRDGVGSVAATTFTGNLAGNAATVTTNANLTGEVTSVGNATTLSNAAVIGKVLTGFAAAAGTVTAADTLLSAIQKNSGTLGNATSTAVANTLMLRDGTGSAFISTLNATSVVATNGDINIATIGKKLLMQGIRAFDATSTTTQSTYLGLNAAGASTTGLQNTGIGHAALGAMTSGPQNTGVGASALAAATTAGYNTAIGFISQQSVTTGGQNTSVGCNSLPALTTGIRNIAMGETCGASLVSGSNNVLLGYGANCAAASANVIAIGSSAVATTNNSVQIGNSTNNQVTFGDPALSVLNCGSVATRGLSAASNIDIVVTTAGTGRLRYATAPTAADNVVNKAYVDGLMVQNDTTITGNWTDGIVSSNHTIRLVRTGNQVTMAIPPVSVLAASSNAAVFSVIIPAAFQPSGSYGQYMTHSVSVVTSISNGHVAGTLFIGTATNSTPGQPGYLAVSPCHSYIGGVERVGWHTNTTSGWLNGITATWMV